MDYKYIEQLLERYWNCETSLEEEQILRSFFRQKEVPAHLLRYKAMFAYQEIEKERGLGSDFDAKVLARVEKPVVKAQRLTLRTRFMPLFKAAAMIAVLFVMGTVVQRSMQDDGSDMVYMHDNKLVMHYMWDLIFSTYHYYDSPLLRLYAVLILPF